MIAAAIGVALGQGQRGPSLRLAVIRYMVFAAAIIGRFMKNAAPTNAIFGVSDSNGKRCVIGACCC